MCRLKLSRLFCLLCALFVFFGSFGLSASAASDNLISSDLTTWTDWSELQDGAADVSVTTKNGIYRITANPIEGYETYLGVVFDHSKLVAGHSYTLSFKMPTLSEINNAFDKDYTQSILDNHFSKCYVQIGIGFISASGSLNVPDDLILFKIEPDNYTKFFGKSLNTSFIASNYSGTPVVFLSISSLNDYDHSFYFSNFKLVDNDDNSAELTGIKGFLHSIRWDLVGGTCEEEDCPHSLGNNPHLSLSERMSSGFASMFQSIGDKFEKGSTLNTWFTNLANKVGNVDSSISDLGDREEGFFSNLGNSIGGFFTDLKTNMSEWFSDIGDWFSDLGDDIGGFFSDLKTKMSTWFSELGNKITTKFQEIGDKFTEFFEKFKPRVYMKFDWRRGFIRFADGSVSFSDTYDAVLISDFFTISDGNKFYIDFIPNKDLGITNFTIFVYDMQGNYLNKNYSYSVASEGIELESGYQYRFRVTLNHLYEENTVNDYFFVYAEEGWVNALLYNMKMGIKGLFVPDEAFIATWKEELEVLLQERLGIIWDAGDFFVSLIQTIGDLLTTTADDIHYELPEMKIELNGETYMLWQAQQVDFSFLQKNAFFAMLYKLYKAVLNVFLGIPLLNYAKKEMDATLHN